MEKLQQFSAGAKYVKPSCKSAVLKSRETILTGSYELHYGSRLGGAGDDLDNNEYGEAF